MDLFELEAVALTGINRVVISHDAYKPGHFSLCFRFTVNTLILCTWLHLYLELSVTLLFVSLCCSWKPTDQLVLARDYKLKCGANFIIITKALQISLTFVGLCFIFCDRYRG